MAWRLAPSLCWKPLAVAPASPVTCVGNGLIGDTFWLVAAHGQQADWVRNISKEPRVRVLVNHRWRSGIATDHRRGIRAGALARATVCRWSRAVAHT